MCNAHIVTYRTCDGLDPQVSLRNEAAESELREFAKTYFSQFKRTPLGMMRLDPQDVGAGYRNVIGLPGGIRSPLMKVRVVVLVVVVLHCDCNCGS